MELKIPPPLLALVLAVTMWCIAKLAGVAAVDVAVARSLALVVFVLGLGINMSAVIAFRLIKTTVNPMKPDTATFLVSKGVYKHTRNPMYLGVLLILCSWALWLGNILNYAVLLFFIWYMTKFQIAPEERALEELFAEEFRSYKTKVRRWI